MSAEVTRQLVNGQTRPGNAHDRKCAKGTWTEVQKKKTLT